MENKTLTSRGSSTRDRLDRSHVRVPPASRFRSKRWMWHPIAEDGRLLAEGGRRQKPKTATRPPVHVRSKRHEEMQDGQDESRSLLAAPPATSGSSALLQFFSSTSGHSHGQF